NLTIDSVGAILSYDYSPWEFVDLMGRDMHARPDIGALSLSGYGPQIMRRRSRAVRLRPSRG
ncbi:MAG: hypothetical protein ACI4SV_05975, partial [Duodenibacillus sp.]